MIAVFLGNVAVSLDNWLQIFLRNVYTSFNGLKIHEEWNIKFKKNPETTEAT